MSDESDNREILIRIYEDDPAKDRGLHLVEEQMHSIKSEDDLTEISREISEVFHRE